MSQGKIHPKATVPFAWENKPGVSKVIIPHHQDRRADIENSAAIKLPPPPPCPPEKAPRVSVHSDPPTFLRISLGKGSIGKPQDQDLDPFLRAYEECTRTPGPSEYRRSQSGHKSGWFGHRLRRNMFDFSCKVSCSVRDDSMVKIQSCRLMNLTSKGDGSGIQGA